jgi:hypothetical protein
VSAVRSEVHVDNHVVVVVAGLKEPLEVVLLPHLGELRAEVLVKADI